MFFKTDTIIQRGFKNFLKIFCRKSNMSFRALFLVKLWHCSRSVPFDTCSCRITERSGRTIFRGILNGRSAGVFAVNEVSEITAFEVSKFMRCKVTELQSFSDLTVCIFANYFLPINTRFM